MPEDCRRIDREEFIAWCEEQTEKSRSLSSRLITRSEEKVHFRLREGEREDGAPEDIVLVDAGDADLLKFIHGDDHRQFASHRRKVTFHDKTLIVRSEEGDEICRAGTGTRQTRGPFPV